jgi:CBS domain-containing protein
MTRTHIGDVMTRHVCTIGPDAPFSEIVERLLALDVSGLPVVDLDGRLLGIVTEADLMSRQAHGGRRRRPLALVAELLRGDDPQWVRKASGRTARELMTAAPVTVSPDDLLAVAARRMLDGHHKRLPVVRDGKLVGLVSRHDLLSPYHRSDAAIEADVQAVLIDPLQVPDEHEAQATVQRGIVRLEGSVRYPSDRAVLRAAVAGVRGVIDVDDALISREEEPRPVDARLPLP